MAQDFNLGRVEGTKIFTVTTSVNATTDPRVTGLNVGDLIVNSGGSGIQIGNMSGVLTGMVVKVATISGTVFTVTHEGSWQVPPMGTRLYKHNITIVAPVICRAQLMIINQNPNQMTRADIAQWLSSNGVSAAIDNVGLVANGIYNHPNGPYLVIRANGNGTTLHLDIIPVSTSFAANTLEYTVPTTATVVDTVVTIG